MQVIVNGASRALPAGARLGELIAELKLGQQRYAVEVNGNIVPRSRHAEHALADGDQILIVQAIGGG